MVKIGVQIETLRNGFALNFDSSIEKSKYFKNYDDAVKAAKKYLDEYKEEFEQDVKDNE